MRFAPSAPVVSFFRRLAPAFAAGLLLWSSAARATISIPLQMQTGNPSAAVATPGNPADPTNHAHYLLQRAQYALDYNDTTREPNWVAWDLTSGDVGGSGRSNFIVDAGLPAGFYQVLTTDYSGSGFDRGHMCPSADRTITVADNQVVFTMSNMVPQTPDNNQGVWASFETYSRSLASAGNELLIISGPSGFAGSTIASGVAIPGYTWKIAVVVPLGAGTAASRITAATRVIAIKIPNTNGIRSFPWQNYLVTPAQIETDTGYTFFTDLSAGIAAALRVKLDGQTSTGAPSITTQPTAQTAAVGGSATFSVTATGNATLTYQWLRDDVEITDAINATLNLTNVQAADAGTYTVIVTNAVGSVTSAGAALVITGLPPTITSQPPARTANAGGTVTFSVTATGSPTLLYQWRKGGVALANGANVAGATAATLTLSNVQSGDAGTYDVVVSNGNLPNATSNGALLTVNPAAPTITSQPSPQTVAVAGTATFSVTATGSATFAYQWRKGGVALANGATGNGSTFAGVTTATLTLTTAQLLDAGNFDVVVSNAIAPAATSTAVALTVSTASASTISYTGGSYTQNFDGLPNTGTFTLTGVGPHALSAAPFNATGLAAWSIAKVTGSGANATFNAGTGSSNTGSAYSFGAAASTERALGAVLSGTVGSAWGVVLTNSTGVTITQFTLSYTGEQWRYGAGTVGGTDKISFEYQLGGADIVAGTFTAATALDFASRVNSATAVGVAGALDGNAAANRLAISSTVTGLSWAPGQTLVLRWKDFDVGGSDDGLAIDDLTFTTPVGAAPTVPAVASTVPAASATGVLSTSPVTITFNQAVTVAGSWFSINSALNGGVSATVTGGPTSFTLTPPANFADNDTITVTVFASQVTEQATGTLHPAANTVFSFTTAAPVAASIVTPPAAQTVSAGSTATFTVVPGGTAPFSYQWRKGGVAISGNASATTATLTLANVQSADVASYDVVVSNGVGSPATSIAALLTVTPAAPTITTQPLPQTVSVGANATFTVAATGTAPFAYQWRKGGVAISGNASAATATLTLPAVSVGDAANYDVVVSNGVNPAATSNSVALAVSTAVLSTVAWDFTTADPTGGLPSDVTGGTVTQGNNNGTTTLITAVSVSSGYTGVSGANNAGAAARTGALSPAASGSAYFEFTLTPAAGKKLIASAISFGARSTSTGPQAFGVFTSVDNFAAPVATGAIASNSTWTLLSPAFTSVTGTTGVAVTFRIFGYNGAGSPAAGTANWRIDDLKLTITTEGVATITLSGLAANFDGTPKTVTATTVPAGLPVTITYNGSATAPSAIGSYAVVATVNGQGYTGTASGTLVISKAAAGISLGGLSATFDGAPKPVTVTTTPAGLAFTVTYAGSATAPSAVGSYSVIASVNTANYAGTAVGTLTIAKAAQTISFAALADKPANSAPFTLSATASSGLPVAFAVVSGPATVNGATLTLAGTPGTVVVRATQTGNDNFAAATAVDQSFAVTAVNIAPAITAQPVAQIVTAGGAASFSVAATGTPAPTYQWRKNGVAIPGATGATLALINVLPADAASYDVVVTNSAGSVTSGAVTLAVIRRSLGGFYFGTLGGGGTFAIFVRPDQTGVFLAFAPGTGIAYVSRAITVDNDGHFRFTTTTTSTLVGIAGEPARAAAEVVFDGTINAAGAVSGGAVGNPALSLAATKSSETGATAALAGFYVAGASNTSAQALAIVGPAGQAFVLASSSTVVDAGVGTVDATGKISVTTANNQTVSATVSAATSSVSATITDSLGRAVAYAGVADGSAAVAQQRLVNISTRARAGSAAEVEIAGFVITGSEPKSVLIRAVGPALDAFGVAGALRAPKLELFRGGTLVATNIGWTTAANSAEISAAAVRAGAFAFAAGSADSALLVTLAPGAYGAIVSSANGQPGVGLAEIYDLSAAAAGQRLANISTRAAVGTTDQTLIAGVVVGGTVPKRVLIRAAGPGLAQFGLAGVLSRPQLTLFSGSAVIAQNAGWNAVPADAAVIAQAGLDVGAFAFANGSADAALVVNLAPGAYTAQVTGVGGATGIALVEIYELP